MFFRDGFDKVAAAIAGGIERDVTATQPVQVLHRDLGGLDVYFVFNPSKEPVTACLSFRGEGAVEEWNAWTGEINPLGRLGSGYRPVSARRVADLGADERRGEGPGGAGADPLPLPVSDRSTARGKRRSHPTLDNRFGDFSLPGSDPSC